jgi:hypothetical protein
MATETQKTPPIKQFRCGAIGVSVWKREHKGEFFYNATASRAFTRDEGKSFEYSDSFGRDDLPIVASLLQQAFSFIVAQTSK